MLSNRLDRPWSALAFVVLALAALLAPPVTAQTNIDVNGAMEFHFRDAGSRSMGMGGAFTAMVDDAAAPVANPAALTTGKDGFQVLLEGRLSKVTTIFPDARSRVLPERVVLQTTETRTTNLNFISLAYHRGKLGIAIYRHELLNQTAHRVPTPEAIENAAFRAPSSSDKRTRVTDNGLAITVPLREGLDLGLAASYYQLSTDAKETVWSPGTDIGWESEETGDDAAMALRAAIRWAPNDAVTVAALYEQGPAFRVTAVVRGFILPVEYFSAPFHLPDRGIVSVAWHVRRSLTLAAEVRWVRYSNLEDGFADILRNREPGDRGYRADDQFESHLGGELERGRLRFRAGVWYDPAHRIWYDTAPRRTQRHREDHIRDRRSSSEFHYGAGLGGNLGARWGRDAAADTSKRLTEASLSRAAKVVRTARTPGPEHFLY